ncbi:N-acetylmuramoyl-L-alanine amidase [Desmospora profundinema]|uniref:Spore cortex-lytic enzyme n=1 Tax=Desmospora profundinema TaxID=1571184 RepID=A0ABU1IPR9_9BACL|nr:spore cortex-lytic enzyme [Desmospora profundinema]MDR6226522.1 N-acetylmuramoyl-L-alanine amidase [Desmospora profundinema]
MNKRLLLLFCTVTLLSTTLTAGIPSDAFAQVERTAEKEMSSAQQGVLQKGSSGEEVSELQGRLQYLGFYKEKIDGTFGNRTYRAVRRFQSQFGLEVDGTVDAKTKKVLWDATKPWAPGVSNRIYHKGDKGGYVWELQRRLQFIGFYAGKIDGQFGRQTDRAVRDFQYRFGLKVDGKVGPRTKLKLWRATRGWSPEAAEGEAERRPGPAAEAPPVTQAKPMERVPRSNAGLSKQDIQIMAQAVHAEARGETYVGQVAVAAVILNRLENDEFPNNPSAIIYEPLAFEAVADGQINMQPNEQARKAVYDAINGWDPSEGAIYYFNPDTATSGWIWGRPQIKRIGKHIFAR